MKKPRKPSITTLKRKCDQAWSLLVRTRDGQCVVCGRRENLQAHHLIHRASLFFRHNPENGVTLCPLCHEFSRALSAHMAPWAFDDWMKEHRREQYEWWTKNRYVVIPNNKIDYASVLDTLRELLEKP